MQKLLFILSTLIPLSLFSQKNEGDTLSILNNKISFVVPKELKPMSDEMWNKKYKSNYKPFLVLADSFAEVSLLVDETKRPTHDSDLIKYKNFRVSNLKNTRNDIKILDEGIKTINNIKIGFIKFHSQAIDQKIFNYYFFLVVKKELLFFTLNCVESFQNKWEPKAEKFISSIILN